MDPVVLSPSCCYDSLDLTAVLSSSRCVLLLLDNLDIDSHWGPMGPVGSSDFSSLLSTNHQQHVNPMDNQVTALTQSLLREQSMEWLLRALRTGQVGRLMMPLLAALLHPATARSSLKACIVREQSSDGSGACHSICALICM